MKTRNFYLTARAFACVAFLFAAASAQADDLTRETGYQLYQIAQAEQLQAGICATVETGIGWAEFYSGLSNCCQVSTTQWHCVGASSFCSPSDHSGGMNVNLSCHKTSGGNDTACETFTDNAAHSISRMKCVCNTSTGNTSCSFVGSCSC